LISDWSDIFDRALKLLVPCSGRDLVISIIPIARNTAIMPQSARNSFFTSSFPHQGHVCLAGLAKVLLLVILKMHLAKVVVAVVAVPA
jgi:hypothetical protein